MPKYAHKNLANMLDIQAGVHSGNNEQPPGTNHDNGDRKKHPVTNLRVQIKRFIPADMRHVQTQYSS